MSTVQTLHFKEFLVASASRSAGPDFADKVILQSDAITGKPIAVFAKITDAVKYTGLDRTAIGGCCRGDRKEYAGFVWSYIGRTAIPKGIVLSAIHLENQKSS